MNRCPHCRAAVGETDETCPTCRGALVPNTVVRDPELLGGNWRLIRLLGTGGMGAVWLAEDVGLQRQVAVKLLAEKLCHDPELIERFMREARLMAKVDHPNVVPVHFVGRWGHIPFIVMKLLGGQALADRAGAQALSLAEIATIARQVCAGLTALHQQGIVHRDIKPANIFIGGDGSVTLLDLGVAREKESELTRTGMIVGTPRYMAPEQVQGQDVGPSADVYSLAVVLYELLSGRQMFDVDSGDSMLRAQVYAMPAPLSTVPEAVWQVIAKGLQKDPQARYATPTEFSVALDAAIAGLPVSASQGTFPGPWGPRATGLAGVEPLEPTHLSKVGWRRASRWGGGLLAAVGVGLAALNFGGGSSGPVAPTAEQANSAARSAAPAPLPPAPEPAPAPVVAAAPPVAAADAGSAPAPAHASRRPQKTAPPHDAEPPPLLPR